MKELYDFKNKKCAILPHRNMTFIFKYKNKIYGACCNICMNIIKDIIDKNPNDKRIKQALIFGKKKNKSKKNKKRKDKMSKVKSKK